MDSRSILVVTDDHAFIVDAVKIGVPRSGRIQLLPGLGLCLLLKFAIAAPTLAANWSGLPKASIWLRLHGFHDSAVRCEGVRYLR